MTDVQPKSQLAGEIVDILCGDWSSPEQTANEIYDHVKRQPIYVLTFIDSRGVIEQFVRDAEPTMRDFTNLGIFFEAQHAFMTKISPQADNLTEVLVIFKAGDSTP